jgi:ATP/ADP translocase
MLTYADTLVVGACGAESITFLKVCVCMSVSALKPCFYEHAVVYAALRSYAESSIGIALVSVIRIVL